MFVLDDTHVDVSNKRSTQFLYILLPVLGIIVALVITVVYKIKKRRTQSRQIPNGKKNNISNIKKIYQNQILISVLSAVNF